MEGRVLNLEGSVPRMAGSIGKLEADVAHMQKDIDGLTDDVGDLKTEMKADLGRMSGRMDRDFRLLFGALITVALGLGGLMVKGFGWL